MRTRLHAAGAALLRVVQTPRQPLVGVALCAAVGIAAVDGWSGSPWLLLLGFLAVTAAWTRWRTASLCWLAVGMGFAALHGFRQQDVPARALARRLGTAGPQGVRAVGRVADEPRARPGAANGRFTLELESIEFGGRTWRTRAPVAVSWPVEPSSPRAPPPPPLPGWGDRVELIGAARNLGPLRNPGQADFTEFARRRGVYSELLASPGPGGETGVREPARGLGSAVVRAAAGMRTWMVRKLALGLRDDPETAAVIRSMVLGLNNRTLLEPDDVGLESGSLGLALQETGTLHFFAVDGLKIGLLAGIILFAFRLVGLRPGAAGVLAAPPLAFYALATGLGPASVRATLSAGVLSVGLWRDRPTRAFNTLGGAAALILLWDGHQLFSRGFQLTFFVVVVILLLHRPLSRGPWARWGAPDPFVPPQLWSAWRRRVLEPARRATLGLAGVSFAAWLGSLPLMVSYFHLFSLSSIPANVLAFPLALGTLALGVLTLAVALVSDAWAVLVNNANWLCAKILAGLVQVAALAPGGHTYVGGVSDYPRLTPWREQPAAELTVLDLGRGASALHLRTGGDGGAGKDWLLDTGRTFDFETTVRPALRARGVNRLDGLVLRQDDAAHAGAAGPALAEFRPRKVFESPLQTTRSPARREWNAALATTGRSAAPGRRGDVLAVAPGIELRVLYPTPDLKPKLADDRGLVLQLRAAGSPARVLLMANAGEETERWLLANTEAKELRSEVLVLGAHRQSVSGGAELLRAVAPRLVVFQADHREGFPGSPIPLSDAEVVRAFAGAAGAVPLPMPAVRRTEQVGAITLRLWRDRAEATGFLDKKTLTVKP